MRTRRQEYDARTSEHISNATSTLRHTLKSLKHRNLRRFGRVGGGNRYVEERPPCLCLGRSDCFRPLGQVAISRFRSALACYFRRPDSLPGESKPRYCTSPEVAFED